MEAFNSKALPVAIPKVRCTCSKDHRNGDFLLSRWAEDLLFMVHRRVLPHTSIQRSLIKVDHLIREVHLTVLHMVDHSHKCPVDTDHLLTSVVAFRKAVDRKAEEDLGQWDQEDLSSPTGQYRLNPFTINIHNWAKSSLKRLWHVTALSAAQQLLGTYVSLHLVAAYPNVRNL